MEIKLSEIQRNKINELISSKQILENELNNITKYINDITEIILDANNVKVEDVENIDFQEKELLVKFIND